MLNNFKWYRALRGGVWYKNKITIDKTGLSDLVHFYKWTRNSYLKDTSKEVGDSVRVVKTETYK